MPDDDIIIITLPPKQQNKAADQAMTDAERLRDLADAVERGDVTVRFAS